MKKKKKTNPNKTAGCTGVPLLGERNLWQMLVMSYTALIEESEEDNKIMETFCWVVLKTGTLTHPHVSLRAP